MKEMDAAAIVKLFQKQCMEYGNAPYSELAALLSVLRAEAQIHQAHHWQTRGPTFYSDHLMYDEIYKSVRKSVDRLAERIVGLSDHNLVSPVVAAHQICEDVDLLYGESKNDLQPNDYATMSYRATCVSLLALRFVYETLEKGKRLTHGTDNLLQDIADAEESNLYFLKQRCKTK